MEGTFLLKTYSCPAENLKVDIWGYSRSIYSGYGRRVTEIYIKQNNVSLRFGGWKFHAWDVVEGIRKAISEMKEDITLQHKMVWTEDEGFCEIYMARDGQRYRMGLGNGYKKDIFSDTVRWINIENLDKLAMVLDSTYEYLNVGEETSSDEDSSSEANHSVV